MSQLFIWYWQLVYAYCWSAKGHSDDTLYRSISYLRYVSSQNRRKCIFFFLVAIVDKHRRRTDESWISIMLLLLKTTVSVINACRRSPLSRLTWLRTTVSSAQTLRSTILCVDEMFVSRTHWHIETIETHVQACLGVEIKGGIASRHLGL